LRRRKCPAPPEDYFRWLDVDLPEEKLGLAVLQIRAATGGARHPATGGQEAVLGSRAGSGGSAAAPTVPVHRRVEYGHAPVWTKEGKSFVCAEHFTRLSELGWTDLWRHFNPGATEWTWRSHQGNGFRVDHAFASPALLPRVRACRYSHVEREARISDHSIVIVEMD
jgi:hypothetical protein